MAGYAEYSLNTPEFRGIWLNIFAPKKQKDDDGKETGKESYGATALFGDGEDLTEIKAMATKLMTDKFGADKTKWPKPRSDKNPGGWRKPWRDQIEKDKANTDADKTYDGFKGGNLFFNMSSERRPQCVDEQVQDILDKAKVYDGAYYIANITLFWYGDKPSSKGNKGIGVSLNCLQKVRDGEPIVSSGSVAAASVFKPIGVNTAKGANAVFEEDDEDPMA